MKSTLRITASCLLFLFSSLLLAQDYKITYQMNYKADSLDSLSKKDEMVLLIKGTKSSFQSKKQFEADSIEQVQVKKNGLNAPRSQNFKNMVHKDHDKKTYSEFLYLLRDFYKVENPLPSFKWEITGETKKIGDYKAQKALLTHSKRQWEAWFTTDIALSEGPSVFYGLPGLILSMKDSKDQYEFNFMGISKSNLNTVHYLSFEPLALTKAQRLKILLNYYNDPYRELTTGSAEYQFWDEDGKQIKPNFNEMKRKTQSQLKAQNNPIELENAVAYP